MNRVNCPNCKHRLKYNDEQVGRKARCQKCNHSFRLPMATREPHPEEKCPANSGAGDWSDPSEQAGGLLNEEEGLKALRDRITALIVEAARYSTLDPALFPPEARAAMLIAECENVNRRIDAEPPNQRVAVAKEILEEKTELLVYQKRLHGRERRSLAFAVAWKLPLLVFQWLLALFLVGAALVGIIQAIRGR